MATRLILRDPRAPALADELARRRGTSITDVVIQAVERVLECGSSPLAARLTALVHRIQAEAGPRARPVTEVDRDAMWSHQYPSLSDDPLRPV